MESVLFLQDGSQNTLMPIRSRQVTSSPSRRTESDGVPRKQNTFPNCEDVKKP